MKYFVGRNYYSKRLQIMKLSKMRSQSCYQVYIIGENHPEGWLSAKAWIETIWANTEKEAMEKITEDKTGLIPWIRMVTIDRRTAQKMMKQKSYTQGQNDTVSQ
ncbi:MAG: hypothetical protein [Microvirus sp.]|nr:MAG: hypothetical protein [Microvirus sp.]